MFLLIFIVSPYGGETVKFSDYIFTKLGISGYISGKCKQVSSK